MTGTGSHRPNRTLAWLAALTAGVLAVGVAVGAADAGAAPSAPPPSPSPSSGAGVSPSPTAPRTGATAKHGKRTPTTCVVAPNGRLTNCAKPVPKSQRPAGARNTTPVDQPISDVASIVDTRTWTSGGGNTFPGAIVPFGMTQW